LADNSQKTYFELTRDLREMDGTLANDFSCELSQECDRIIQMVQTGQTDAAIQNLRQLKERIRSDMTTIAKYITERSERDHKKNIEMMVLRRDRAFGAKMYATITGDEEGIQAMDDLLKGYDEFFAAGIADLDFEPEINSQ